MTCDEVVAIHNAAIPVINERIVVTGRDPRGFVTRFARYHLDR